MLIHLAQFGASRLPSSVTRKSIFRHFVAATASCFLLSHSARAFGSRLAMSASPGPITIVTGSNKGIGLEILKKLAPTSSVAILAARNPSLGEQAAQELRDHGLENVIYRPLDVSSAESIEHFVDEIQKDFGRADILVNNAGIAFKGRDPTPFRDQAAPTFKTNFWGTVELIDAMTPLLRKSTGCPCIVNVASQSGRLGILDTDRGKQAEISSPTLTRDRLFELVRQFEHDVKTGTHAEKGWPNTCYGMSKLALIAFGRVFARNEMEGGTEKEGKTSIWLASCCPGWCDTDMSSHSGPRTAEHGARTPAWLAMEGRKQGATAGGFFYDEKEIQW